MTADIATFDRWKEQSHRDDWHNTFVGSDIREMLGEIERLRAQRDSLQKEVDACHALDCFSLGQVNKRLQTALALSVNLQSHYASLLNMHDGGKRIEFADADAWLKRLDARQ